MQEDDNKDRDGAFGDEADPTPPAAVTPGLFQLWRAPRYGRANPERMNNPVWDWLIRSRLSAYRANEMLGGASSFEEGPCWSFDRFGQSRTELPDGRVVFIGGEHEDSYDPDFFIYNDVVVRHPDGALDIYGYPKEAFAPTDFHTATLDGGRVVIVGAFGNPDERKPGVTQVYVLDLATFAITRKECVGAAPGWLHRHKATFDAADNAIVVTGGQIDTGDDERNLIENIDDWKLHLGNWRWERLTKRQWPRWDVCRDDRAINALFDIRSLAYWTDVKEGTRAEESAEQLREELGFVPDLDLLAALYDPPVQHEKLPEVEDEYQISRIAVNGVTVRYEETMWYVRLTVEGDLPAATAAALTSDLRDKLSALERKPYELIRL